MIFEYMNMIEMAEERKIFQLHAELCKILSNPIRLEILNLLRGGEKTVGELVAAADLRQANLSQHLALMRQRGVLLARREGANVYYGISDPKIVRACELIREVLFKQLTEGKNWLRRQVVVAEDETLKPTIGHKTNSAVRPRVGGKG